MIIAIIGIYYISYPFNPVVDMPSTKYFFTFISDSACGTAAENALQSA